MLFRRPKDYQAQAPLQPAAQSAAHAQ